MQIQKRDFEELGKLFDIANSDGKDEESWAAKFKEHLDKCVGKHSANVKALGQDSSERKREVLRTRLELQSIVHERLEARAAESDEGLAEALKALCASWSGIIQEMLKSRAPMPRGGGGTTFAGASKETQKSPMSADLNASTTSAEGKPRKSQGGGSAFAAAARERSSHAEIVSPMQQPLSPTTPPPVVSLVEAATVKEPAEEEDEILSGAESSPFRQTHQRSPRRLKDRNEPVTYAKIHMSQRERSGASTSARPGKDLTLRQLRDIVTSVYTSKAERDAKCVETGESCETMEAHLYAFLGKRYGLKSVIQEWASAIFRSIQRFAPRECDIAVFGKILQNTLAESFPAVQETLRSTVQQLLKSQLEQRHPNRTQTEIDALWRARARCGVPMVECEEVVRYMYNESDSTEVLSRLSDLAVDSAQAEMQEPDSVRYRDLLQVLLSFQMNLTEHFLADFVTSFREVDSDGDGVLTHLQMEDLVSRIGNVYEANEAASFLLVDAKAATMSAISPYDQATFSQSVDLFTGLISARWAASVKPDGSM